MERAVRSIFKLRFFCSVKVLLHRKQKSFLISFYFVKSWILCFLDGEQFNKYASMLFIHIFSINLTWKRKRFRSFSALFYFYKYDHINALPRLLFFQILVKIGESLWIHPVSQLFFYFYKYYYRMENKYILFKKQSFSYYFC